jgi:hypothetical protein
MFHVEDLIRCTVPILKGSLQQYQAETMFTNYHARITENPLPASPTTPTNLLLETALVIMCFVMIRNRGSGTRIILCSGP